MSEDNNNFKKQTIIECGNNNKIYQIDPSRQYWFIRSDSGNYYQDFIQNNYVAIGWDYLLQSNFQFDQTGKLLNDVELKALIDKNEKVHLGQSEQGRKTTITKIFNKVHKFIFEIEEGDIVITPSENTSQLSIGIVVGNLYEDTKYETEYLAKNPDTELTLCPFVKRRNIHWLKHISRKQLDIYLLSSFQSQEAMTNLNTCSDYINRNLYDAYIDKNQFHSIVQTSSDKTLTLFETAALFSNLSNLVTDISETNNLNLTPQDIEIKINAHSPLMLDLSVFADNIVPIAKYLVTGLGAYLFFHPKSVTQIINKFVDRDIELKKASIELNKIKLQEGTKQKEIESKERIELAKLNPQLGSYVVTQKKLKIKKRNPNKDSETP